MSALTTTAPPSQAFDWHSAYQRLDRALAKVEGTETLSSEEIRKRLRERAARLAEPPAEEGHRQLLDLVVFAIGGSRYAVEAAQAEAVTSIGIVTPLLDLPEFYLGVVGHRGAVYPLVDIRPLLGLSVDKPARPAHAILLADAQQAIAVATEAIDGFVRIDAADVAASGSGQAGPSLVGGITSSSIVIVDAARLLRDARLVVDRQPTAPVRGEEERQ